MTTKKLQLDDGEINTLRALAEIVTTTKALIGGEIERLEKLRSNPTFPITTYAKQVNQIRIAGKHLQQSATEVKP